MLGVSFEHVLLVVVNLVRSLLTIESQSIVWRSEEVGSAQLVTWHCRARRVEGILHVAILIAVPSVHCHRL